ncbi:MAG: YlbF family regulator [Lachnospiraceae bacterium]|nr:YlbF family regulator [Lachnospiraceae bacterium]
MDDSVQKIVETIKSTPEYTLYKSTRDEIYDDPDLWAKAERIRTEYNEVLSIKDERQIMQALDAFMERNEEDYAITEIHDALEAETGFFKMMQNVIDKLAGDIRS